MLGETMRFTTGPMLLSNDQKEEVQRNANGCIKKIMSMRGETAPEIREALIDMAGTNPYFIPVSIQNRSLFDEAVAMIKGMSPSQIADLTKELSKPEWENIHLSTTLPLAREYILLLILIEFIRDRENLGKVTMKLMEHIVDGQDQKFLTTALFGIDDENGDRLKKILAPFAALYIGNDSDVAAQLYDAIGFRETRPDVVFGTEVTSLILAFEKYDSAVIPTSSLAKVHIGIGLEKGIRILDGSGDYLISAYTPDLRSLDKKIIPRWIKENKVWKAMDQATMDSFINLIVEKRAASILWSLIYYDIIDPSYYITSVKKDIATWAIDQDRLELFLGCIYYNIARSRSYVGGKTPSTVDPRTVFEDKGNREFWASGLDVSNARGSIKRWLQENPDGKVIRL